MQQSPVVIGSNHMGYLEKKLIFDLPQHKYIHQKVWDWVQFPNWLVFKYQGYHNWRLNNSYYGRGIRPLLYPNIRLHHFFNSIGYDNFPYVVTGETLVPRYHGTTEREMARLAKPNCKKVLFHTACGYHYQRLLLENNFPGLVEDILPKCDVHMTSQYPLINELSEKQLPREHLQFFFVGGDFYRKGGLEVLRAVGHVLDLGRAVKMTLVGNLTPSNFPYPATPEDRREAEQLLAKHSDHITYLERMPNPEVLRNMRDSHVFILPTLSDALPFSVMEALGSGTPVLGNNVRAMPEVLDNENGWVVNLPVDERGELGIADRTVYNKVSKRLTEEMCSILEQITAQPEEIHKRMPNCLERVHRDFSPQDRADYLVELYDHILEGGPEPTARWGPLAARPAASA